MAQAPQLTSSGLYRGDIRHLIFSLTLSVSCVLSSCKSDQNKTSMTTSSAGEDGGISLETESETAIGSCQYTNLFSGSSECREYTGEGWTLQSAEDDCGGLEESMSARSGCDQAQALGRCLIDQGAPLAYDLILSGAAPTGCQLAAQGCVTFARGEFRPTARCEGEFEPVAPVLPDDVGTVFVPFEQICLEEEDGGAQCAWQAIGGCAPEGSHFTDFASCTPVFTQRPYVPVPASGFTTPEDDPLQTDEAFLAESEWVRSQANSCGCVCCHENTYAPSGAAVWDTDREGLWVDDWNPRGLAMGAGWLDSSALGAFDAEINNGFDRSQTVLPTTDVARMTRFFEGELARRGFSREDFEDATPIGGPLYEQVRYTPSRCEQGEGVGPDGVLAWRGGAGRYFYVLSAEANSPGVPPNYDIPEGTIWKLDVDHREAGLTSVRYGEVPVRARQAFPVEGNPEALVEGQQYYLYVLKDIAIPITRCLFTYGEVESPSPEVTTPWGQACTRAEDCPEPTNFCVMAPGDTEGYCSTHCESAARCNEVGAPSSWACVALSCETEAFTWCGEPSEVEASGGFLKLCP